MPSLASTLPRVTATPIPGMPEPTIVNEAWIVLGAGCSRRPSCAVIVYVPGAVAAKGCVYEAPEPGARSWGASPSRVTVIAYQLVSWLALKVIESTEPRIAPSAGLVPRNEIGGGGGRRRDARRCRSELRTCGRTQASGRSGLSAASAPCR